jgi:hypothetical protein
LKIEYWYDLHIKKPRIFTKLTLAVASKEQVKKMWERLVAAKLNDAAGSGSYRNLSNVNLAYPDNRVKFFTESAPALDNASIRENSSQFVAKNLKAKIDSIPQIFNRQFSIFNNFTGP